MPRNQAIQSSVFYTAKRGEVKKVILLYSGSVYTAVLIKWLQKNYKVDVIALLVDLGQNIDFTALKGQAQSLGAVKSIVIDAKEEFARDFITKAIKANATYQHHYHLFTPLGRQLLAKKAVEVAEREGASAIAHGSSSQSNDQIRLEQNILSLNQDLKIIAPFREGFSRDEAQKLAKEYKIPQGYEEKGYSYDGNLWGVSVIGGDIESTQLPSRIEHLLKLTKIPEHASDIPERLSIEFREGIPTKVNDKELPLVGLIEELNTIGGRNGIGLSYTIEDMIFGLKNRSIDEEPGATLLTSAHRELEKYLSTRRENEFKALIDNKWTYLCHESLWCEPLMRDLEGYIDTVNKKVTGKVSLRLYKGNLEIVSIQTERTVQEKKLAVSQNGIITPEAVAGYVELASLPIRLANRAEKTILLSIGKRTNKFKLLPQLRKLDPKRFQVYATYKTHKFLLAQDINAILVNKIHQPHLKPNLADLLEQNRFDLIIRIPSTKSKTVKEAGDSKYILQKAKEFNVPVITNVDEAQQLLEDMKKE